uniref:Uncharacterized protein n=1 Tax=Oryza nivara TaxID=4536 RepID=A0A0E0IA91_ORYNI
MAQLSIEYSTENCTMVDMGEFFVRKNHLTCLLSEDEFVNDDEDITPFRFKVPGVLLCCKTNKAVMTTGEQSEDTKDSDDDVVILGNRQWKFNSIKDINETKELELQSVLKKDEPLESDCFNMAIRKFIRFIKLKKQYRIIAWTCNFGYITILVCHALSFIVVILDQEAMRKACPSSRWNKDITLWRQIIVNNPFLDRMMAS